MSTAEEALAAFARDLVEEIAAGRAIELTDAELARREKIEREAEPPATYPAPWTRSMAGDGITR